jgi:hypothetical protein
MTASSLKISADGYDIIGSAYCQEERKKMVTGGKEKGTWHGKNPQVEKRYGG